MNLFDGLNEHKHIQKHVDEPVAGTHTISAANFGGGFYKDFTPDDPAKRSPFSTSQHWYKRELETYYENEEGWEQQ